MRKKRQVKECWEKGDKNRKKKKQIRNKEVKRTK